MIETVVRVAAHDIRAVLDGNQPDQKAAWNTVCLADSDETGASFMALPQLPSRNVNWFKEGKWVPLAEPAMETRFLRKMKKCSTEPICEKHPLCLRVVKTLM